jgi:ketosteroid isomerase-like protein
MEETRDYSVADEILALERSALDRLYKGDPGGYLELYAESLTYFDTRTPLRVDGHQAIENYMRPLRGKVSADRYEMLNPDVQLYGDAAILTYNLVTYELQDNGTEKVLNRWNSAQVYSPVKGAWKIVHAHWSLTNQLEGSLA